MYALMIGAGRSTVNWRCHIRAVPGEHDVTLFSLVHGAWHGAWCFDLLATELRRLGHDVVAVDLPLEDAAAGAVRYAEVVAQSLGGCGRPAVMLGHSMAGLVLPLLPPLVPVQRLVLLCALLPRPGHPFADPAAGRISREDDGLIIDPAGRSRWSPERAVDALYGDVARDVARAAARRLRPQASLPFTEPTPLVRWPAVPTTAIYCAEDKIVPAALFAEQARAVADLEPLLLPGGHFPFLSSPRALAAHLDGLA